MSTKEIPTQDWRKFCEQFTEFNRGSMLSIEIIDINGHRTPIAENVMLQGVTLDDKTDPCNDLVTFTLGEPGTQLAEHTVIEPIHIRIRQNGDQRKLLEIVAESGTTLVNFHSGKFPAIIPELRFENARG